MSAAGNRVRVWTLLARVRQVRVQRCRQALARRQHEAHVARMALARQTALHEAHAATLPELLSLCGHDQHEAGLWRLALGQHRIRDTALSEADRIAQAALVDAVTEVREATAALRREMRALDDARMRERKARLPVRE